MKKKLIQILMLLVATVSVGAFVSCKDTNEDLYNELRTKDLENASVAEALAARIDALERLVADITSCKCDTVKMLGWVNSEDAWLQAQIAALDAALDALANSTYTKDEVDDLLADLADQYAALADFVELKKDFDTYVVNNNADVRVLQEKVKELQDALKDIVSCKCDLEKLGILEGRIIEAEANAKEALDGLKDIEKIANAAQTAADKAQDAADKAQKTADDAATLAQSANTTAAEAKALADACKTLLDTAVKTATEAKTIATEAKTLAETNKSRIEKLEKDLQTLDSKINVVSETANQAMKDAAAAAAKADANKALIDKLTDRVTTNETNIATNKANIEALQKSVEKLQDLAEKVGANTEAIKTLKDDVKSLNTKYDEMSTTLAALQQQVTDCQTMCQTNLELAKAELRAEIQDLETQLLKDIAVNNQAIEDLRKQHESDVEWIKEALRQISQKADGFVTQTELNDALKPINDKLTELETKDTELQKELNNLDKDIKDLEPRVKTLETNYETLKKDVDEAKAKVDALANDVIQLTTTVQGLQDYLGRLVTGITIQGTQNPMFGSFSIPGIEPYVLVAYYGTPVGGGKFPTSNTAHLIYDGDPVPLPSECLTAKDMDMLRLSGSVPEFEYEASIPLVTGGIDGKAYAGKIYMTINPTSADFKGLDLSIVNTKDESSVFTLENTHHSQAALQWGYTRATTNGFYEADAYVDNTALNGVERPYSEQAIKDLAKEAKDQLKDIIDGKLAKGNTGLDELATDVYDVIRTLRLEKSGLKCEYTGLKGTPEAVYSQYNLAATALKPLGLEVGKDFHYVTVPGYERVENLFDRLANELKKKFKTVIDKVGENALVKEVSGLDFKSFKLEPLDKPKPGEETLPDEERWFYKTFVMTVGDDVKIDGLTYHFTLPTGTGLDVLFDPGVTINGTPVNVPSNKTMKISTAEKESNATEPSIVIYGNVTATSVPMKLVIPANTKDKDGNDVWKYVWYDIDSSVDINAKLNTVGTNQVLEIDSQTAATFAPAGSNYMVVSTSKVNASKVIDFSNNGVEPTITVSFTVDLRNVANGIWGNVLNLNNMLDNLQGIIDDINKYLNDIDKYTNTFNGYVDDYLGHTGKLHKYLDKINEVIINFVNGINYQLRPFMVTEDAKGFKVISANKIKPTEMVKNQLKIYPTSKTMEIFVPFARKHVAVTNVFVDGDLSTNAQDGDAVCQAKLIAANTGELNTIIDGTQRMIEVNGLVSGYIYEIAYSALDFRGNIATRKGYIVIK